MEVLNHKTPQEHPAASLWNLQIKTKYYNHFNSNKLNNLMPGSKGSKGRRQIP